MTLQSLQCPHCGAILSITNSTKVAHCEFCDSDIMIEQPQNQQNIPLQQYAEQKIPPEFVTRNDMPLQPYQKQNLNAGQQSPYYPPAGRTDEYAFQQWKTKFICCHIALYLSIFIWLILIFKDSHSMPALFPFLIALCIFTVAPILLAATKPDEADSRKNHKGWNILKYYLLFAGNIFFSFLFTIIISMIFGIE